MAVAWGAVNQGAGADGGGRRYWARARYEGRTVAESTEAVRLDRVGQAPLLWFPLADVDLSSLTEADRGVLTELDGAGTFDQTRVQVEILDGSPGDDPLAVPVLQFPTWGDAADLIELLDVQPVAPLRYRSGVRADWRRPVTEGSQLLAQAIVAAARHAPGRRAVSAHLVLTRVADAREPVEVQLDEVSDGRTFTTLDVRVVQRDRCCATGTVLLDATAPDVVRHAVEAPPAPRPEDCPPFDMSVTGRELRIADGAYTGDPRAAAGPPTLDAWVRFRDVPADPVLHAALLAQFTGHLPIAAALRPHEGIGQDQAHDSLSMAINAISISFHREVRADRWMHYHHQSTFAGDGMTHAACTVHDEEGRLLASFSVDAMVRAFAERPADHDPRTAL